ncbi:MAG: alpha/beta fold hydrolase, partial [Spongiibacteraceae bacterium]
TVQLRDIHAKVLIIVGDKDPIVTPSASKVWVDLMENADCDIREVPGGHMSIVSGSAAPVAIWPQVLAWLDRAV